MTETNSQKISSNSKFFNIVIQISKQTNNLSGICIGFEDGEWRSLQFSDLLFEYLPEFALSYSERLKFGPTGRQNVRLLRTAAKTIYETDKFKNRGEFGELILHAILRELFCSETAISKIFFKDGQNDTVKGFDAVHVVSINNDLELWLGEVKFYDDFSTAMSHVITELKDHFEKIYLRNEFIAITNKIDSQWPYSDKLKQLLDPDVSLDKIFTAMCVPVLLTYNSKIVRDYDKIRDEYTTKLKEEFCKYYARFFEKELPINIKIHLILLPLKSKVNLVDDLHKKLLSWKNI